jgi:hypothetical protein
MIRKHTMLGAVGAGALVVVSIVGPASAAGEYTSTGVVYTCFGGAIHPPADFTVDAPATTTLVAGQKVKPAASMTVTLGPLATNQLRGLGWDHFTGVVSAPSPSQTLGAKINVPSTPVGPASGNTVATGSGTVTLDYPTAGTKTMRTGNFTATLTGFNASDVQVGNPVPIDCVAPTDGTTVLKDSLSNPLAITVAKDSSTTSVTAAYSKAHKKATGTAKVKGATYGLRGTGKVKFTLKRGTHKVATKTVSLKKGAAKAVFAKVSKRGRYTISGSYLGSGGLKKSSDKAGFRIR